MKIVASKRNVEVRLTEEEAAAARSLLTQLVDGGAARLPVELKLPELACRIHSSRRERRRFVPDDVVAEPAWDMILVLFCAEARGERLSVTGLGYSVGLPQATAARWIASLTKAGLIEQQQDDRDRRRRFLKLSPLAQDNVISWLSRVEGLLQPSLPGFLPDDPDKNTPE
jgi:DNA-binding transcriptional ArsR family regulator